MAKRDEEFTAWAWDHTRGLYRRALLLSGDRQHAEDLVQETLTKLYLHWSRVDLDANPLAYAHSILFHVFISGRRRKSAGERPVDTIPERPAQTDDADLRLDLTAALRTLTPRERCVVVARYVDDRSVAETATLLRRTEGWVRTTAYRALKRLRDCPELLAEPSPLLTRRTSR